MHGDGLLRPVGREILRDWTLWLDRHAPWEDGPQSLDAAIDGLIDDWRPQPPTGGWEVLDNGAPVKVPATTDAESAGYHGVSWWSTTVEVDAGTSPTLIFGAARLLAEVFWDRELVGVDLEGYTPFRIDIPEHLAGAGSHRIDVRITNPGGAVGWDDHRPLLWGPFTLPSSHDFGGLWQPVTLETTTSVRVLDVWARSDAALGAALIDVVAETRGSAILRVDLIAPDGVVVETKSSDIPEGGRHTERTVIAVPSPRLYGPGAPELYRVIVSLRDAHASDEVSRRLGFRSLDVTDDGSLAYNGTPFYLRTAISWGRYSNGPVPSEQELSDEIQSLVALGQNAVTAHRSTVTPALADALEDAGLLLYQEPGGMPSLSAGGSGWLSGDELGHASRLMEKRIRRLARRDRSRACLVWWNLANEFFAIDDGDPGPLGWSFLAALREEDDSRITTFASAWNPTPLLRPFDDRPASAFDFHTVLNWPAGWSPAVEETYAAIRPPRPMPVISGESTNMAGLGWLLEQAAGDPATGESAAARRWLDSLERDLALQDPEMRVGGVAELCAATARNQAYGIARMIEANRANPDIDGLAINGWHAHSAIGAQGLTGPNRRLAVDASAIRQANAPVAITLQDVTPVILSGDRQSVRLLLLDDRGDLHGDVEIDVRQQDSSGHPARRDSLRVHLPAGGGRVRHLAELELVAGRPGLQEVEVRIRIGDHSVSTNASFRAVRPANLNGLHLAVHDPQSRVQSFLAETGVEASRWRMFDRGPTLFAPSSIDLWPQLLSGTASRAVCLLDDHPSADGATEFARLRLKLFRPADETPGPDDALAPFVDVQGHWIGGWGMTMDPAPMPTLSDSPVWDWTLNSLVPTYAFRPTGIGATVTAATTFPEGGAYAMGAPRVCPSSVLLERGGRQVIVTTMPLALRSPHDPLAQAVLADLIEWASLGQEAPHPAPLAYRRPLPSSATPIRQAVPGPTPL